MIRHIILMLSLLQIAHANADTGADWWKNCPGPACSAREPDSHIRESEKVNKDYERMDREEIRKERETHDDAIKAIEKEERRRINR